MGCPKLHTPHLMLQILSVFALKCIRKKQLNINGHKIYMLAKIRIYTI